MPTESLSNIASVAKLSDIVADRATPPTQPQQGTWRDIPGEALKTIINPQDPTRKVIDFGGGLKMGPAPPGSANEKIQQAMTTIGKQFSPLDPSLMERPGLTLASFAIPLAGKAAPKLLGLSKARAAANLTSASEAAKSVPINVERVGQEGLRAMEMQAAGASMPRAATQFMRRITDPKAADLTWSEARDFYSNLSRLSANEMGRLNPAMQRQIIAMRKALHDALVEGAERVGKGGAYSAGIREYARSAKAGEALQKLGKYGAAAAGGGLIADYLIERVAGKR